MRYCFKKNRPENRKRCAEKRKTEDKICVTSKRKKYNLGHNYKYSQIQKPQDKSSYDSARADSKKCLHK